MGKKIEPVAGPGGEQDIWQDQPEIPDVDWEKPPVYVLKGSGPNASTSVVAQGMYSHI
jgi:hypothetical protein